MKLFKSFTEPTDLIIIGTAIDGFPSFSLTDDYQSLWLRHKNTEGYGTCIETDGYVTLMTLDEFKRHDFDDEDIKENDTDDYFVWVKNFTGNVNVSITEEGTYNDITPEDLDLDDYVMYQVPEDKELEDVAIVFDTVAEGQVYSWVDLTAAIKESEKEYTLDYFIGINRSESKEDLLRNLKEYADEDGFIKGVSKKLSLDKLTRGIEGYFDGTLNPNYITRELGLRQQAMYIKYYEDLDKFNSDQFSGMMIKSYTDKIEDKKKSIEE